MEVSEAASNVSYKIDDRTGPWIDVKRWMDEQVRERGREGGSREREGRRKGRREGKGRGVYTVESLYHETRTPL